MSAYRIQVSGVGGLHGVADLVPYLRALGASTLYLSPVFKARSGSTHGYDVVDPGRVDPALGGEAAFERLAAACEEANLSLLLDIVPNHMATSHENPWWWSVLEAGPASPCSSYFDLDWGEPVEPVRGRVVLPILGKRYHSVLDSGDLQVVAVRDGYVLKYYEHVLPLDVSSHAVLSGSDPEAPEGPADVVERLNRARTDPAARAELDALLCRQAYWLVHWRTASEEVNYRRFFDISHLIALRMERPDVFEAWHRLLADLIRRFPVEGVRVDHVDGLADPEEYLGRLRGLVDEASGEPGRTVVLVEKILAAGEKLPDSWDTDGTTGYDFLAAAEGALVDADGVADIEARYRTFASVAGGFQAETRRTRRRTIRSHFRRDLDRLVGIALPLVRSDPRGRDLARSEVSAALLELSIQLDVYRTYLTGSAGPAARPRAPLDEAARRARRRRDFPVAAVDVLADILTREPREAEALALTKAWQQFTGAVMAKGVEDTAFYVHTALISRNEVGSHPDSDPGGVEGFHTDIAARGAAWPRALNATSTHDTKRSEDVRARIHVLSEMAQEWDERVRRWRAWNRELRRTVGDVSVPTAAEEWFLYQTLVGVWPLHDEELEHLPDRLEGYLRKAAREAKVYTSWHRPRPAHEDALVAFMRGILDPERDSPFRSDFLELHEHTSFHGAVNALSLLLLKLAAPGRPDVYQGNELWRFSLVDPDNRRPVDWSGRRRRLEELSSVFAPPEGAGEGHPGEGPGAPSRTAEPRGASDIDGAVFELLREWKDGRVKMLVTWKGLSFRRRHPGLLTEGAYHGVPVTGAKGRHALAFARRDGDRWALAVVPRLPGGLTRPGTFPVGDAVWTDTSLRLPDGAPDTWTDVLTGHPEPLRATDSRLPVARALGRLPVALLSGRSGGG